MAGSTVGPSPWSPLKLLCYNLGKESLFYQFCCPQGITVNVRLDYTNEDSFTESLLKALC